MMMRKDNKIILLLIIMALCLTGCNSKREDPGVFEEYTGAYATEDSTEKAAVTEEKTTKEITTEATVAEVTTEEKTEAETVTTEENTTTEDSSNTTTEQSGPVPEAEDFVLVSDVIPDVVLEIRYYTDYNFVGKRVDGYEEPVALLTKEAATALKEVSDDLSAKGYKLKIYDAYRPQTAVDNFVEWAGDLNDTKMKQDFYPELDKSVLFDQGYIATHSGHSRGSTVDLTIVDKNTGMDVDMGGTFDYFGQKSHVDYEGITEAQHANRMILRDAMTSHGFNPYSEEWWHFTLANEPYPNTYFEFPVNSSSVGK